MSNIYNSVLSCDGKDLTSFSQHPHQHKHKTKCILKGIVGLQFQNRPFESNINNISLTVVALFIVGLFPGFISMISPGRVGRYDATFVVIVTSLLAFPSSRS